MTIKISDTFSGQVQTSPSAFLGKTTEQVVLDLMSRTNALEVKLQASKERITQLETKVASLESAMHGLPQKVTEHSATLKEHADKLTSHENYLYFLKAVLKVELFNGGYSWSGMLGPEHLRVEIKAKQIKVESLSELTLKGAWKTELQADGPLCIQASSVSADGSAEFRISAATFKVDTAMTEFLSPMVKCKNVVSCEHLNAVSVASTSYTPGKGNIW